MPVNTTTIDAEVGHNESGRLLPELIPILEAFSETCPASSKLAGRTLATICRPWIEQLRLGSPLHTSLLTPGGYPLEFSCRTNSDDIIYTIDPGLPHRSVEKKWEFLRAISDQLDTRSHPLLPVLAAQPSQRFGCWLSIRHRKYTTHFKIYQEVSPEAGELILRRLGSFVPGSVKADSITPKLLGVVLGENGTTEYYCKVNDPSPGALHGLFAPAGVARRLPSIMDYLAFLAAEQSDELLRRLSIGISFSVSGTKPPSLTLFAHSQQLFPTNRLARSRLLGLARQLGLRMTSYERITEAFDNSEPREMVHGLVGIKIDVEGDLEYTVGIRPFS